MKKLFVVLVIAALVAMGVKWVLAERETQAAEPYQGGQVLELDGPDVNARQYLPTGAAQPGPAVVLLHGYASSIQWWQPIAQKLANRTGLRVVALDLLGHGGSESPSSADDFGVAAQSGAVLEALAALEIGEAVLVGHSMGGHVATGVAEQAPDLVQRFAVIDTWSAPGEVELSPLRGLACAPFVGPTVDLLRPVEFVAQSGLQDGFADDFEVPDYAFDSLARMTWTGFCNAGAGDEMNDGESVAERAAGTGKEVLVIWGERDVLTPPEGNVDSWREAGFAPQLIEEAGHTPQVETPEQTLDLLVPFIETA